METKTIATRLNVDMYDAFVEEAQNRGQSPAALLRTFIRDGLSRYDAINEQILQNGELIIRRIELLELFTAANLHVDIQKLVFEHTQAENEEKNAYAERLKSIYVKMVYEAIAKGGGMRDAILSRQNK